ncbi:60S ribosomal protein L18a-like protein [Rhynchospora pubera]|uniref:60S ribosomal protein L18a-like protein n=1 Tax=Rhynchospora pubera TaxID=906938 RepID=A0AAV8ER90_9POAL|nr:60S ribosomal protein L18a-like protein [Rhynchospora pubera]
MSEEEAKSRGVMGSDSQHQSQYPPQPQYGTFDGGAPGYPQPVMGSPQPAPPPGVAASLPYRTPYTSVPTYYPYSYQGVAGYGTVAEGQPVRRRRLPCCGIGIGWCLFILGFFFAAIPWYVGALVLLCSRVDYREKPGLIVCTIAAILAAIAVLFGVTKGADVW